ncbi:MAG: DUF2142 domain-containing protein [Planctomycetota bacterium]
MVSKEGELRPEVVFFCIALVFGLALVLVNAPFQIQDGGTHFFRAYHVSQGDYVTSRKGDSVGGKIPESAISLPGNYGHLSGYRELRVDRDTFWTDFNRPLEPKNKVFVDFFTQSLYAPTVYLPQAAGILLGRLGEWSALKLMYAGRISALLCWIAIVFAAIRITPVFKWVFVLVALLPKSLSLAASLSADGPTNAVAFLLTAVLLRGILGNEAKLNNWDVLFIITLSVLLSMAKQVYLPLVGMIFLIPVQKFKSSNNKLVFCGLVIGAAVLATGLWTMEVRGLYRSWYGADAPQQMKLVLARPWEFPLIAFDTFIEHWTEFRLAFVGVLGFLDVWLPKWVYRSYPFVLVGVALFSTDCEKPFPWPQRCWLIALCVCSFLLIYLSMYLVWTEPGAERVKGVHARYFLPLAVPMLLALFYNRRHKLRLGYWGPMAVGLYLCAVWTVTCWSVWIRFYGPV